MAKKTAAKTKKVNLGKAGSWTSHPGRLHREMGIPEGKKIPMSRKRAALKSKNPQERRDARSAIGYAHMNHAGKGGKREAKGHDAVGEHPGYSMMMKKKK